MYIYIYIYIYIYMIIALDITSDKIVINGTKAAVCEKENSEFKLPLNLLI